MFTNEKIFEFLKDHWRVAIIVIGVAMFCISLLYCSKNGAEFLVKNNKVIISKTKTK